MSCVAVMGSQQDSAPPRRLTQNFSLANAILLTGSVVLGAHSRRIRDSVAPDLAAVRSATQRSRRREEPKWAVVAYREGGLKRDPISSVIAHLGHCRILLYPIWRR